MSEDIYKDLVQAHDVLTRYNPESVEAALLWLAAEEILRLQESLKEVRRAASWRAKRRVEILDAEIKRLKAGGEG